MVELGKESRRDVGLTEVVNLMDETGSTLEASGSRCTSRMKRVLKVDLIDISLCEEWSTLQIFHTVPLLPAYQSSTSM